MQPNGSQRVTPLSSAGASHHHSLHPPPPTHTEPAGGAPSGPGGGIKRVEFVDCFVVMRKDKTWWGVESYLLGKYVKYNARQPPW